LRDERTCRSKESARFLSTIDLAAQVSLQERGFAFL
jgi:hypothetical protein